MIRVCPERDSRCPHGPSCPYVKDRYSCKDGWSVLPGAPPVPKAAELTNQEQK